MKSAHLLNQINKNVTPKILCCSQTSHLLPFFVAVHFGAIYLFIYYIYIFLIFPSVYRNSKKKWQKCYLYFFNYFLLLFSLSSTLMYTNHVITVCLSDISRRKKLNKKAAELFCFSVSGENHTFNVMDFKQIHPLSLTLVFLFES